MGVGAVFKAEAVSKGNCCFHDDDVFSLFISFATALRAHISTATAAAKPQAAPTRMNREGGMGMGGLGLGFGEGGAGFANLFAEARNVRADAGGMTGVLFFDLIFIRLLKPD